MLWFDSFDDHIGLLRFAIRRLEIYGPDLRVVVLASKCFVASDDFSTLKDLFGDDLPTVSGFLPHARDATLHPWATADPSLFVYAEPDRGA